MRSFMFCCVLISEGLWEIVCFKGLWVFCVFVQILLCDFYFFLSV